MRRCVIGGSMSVMLAAVASVVVVAADPVTLTTAQKTALKADIVANSDTNTACVTNGDLTATAALYNVTASPAYWAWRSYVARDEYLLTTSVDGTVFSFVGAGYITRSQGERDAFLALFDTYGYTNPSRSNVRQAVGDIFSGATAPAPANRTHLLTISRRTVTRLEKLFAIDTPGSAATRGTTADPDTLVVEGSLTTDTLIGLCP